ncbi:unnamed protein product [Porites lobata]|uniref:F5/8 type C domain-containing protein n=1 Tax=Porites lobata TaxID=104759 RepID=A0ABN8QLG8_9CNID|nr:unnamed protein product [Porites lobata]
MEIYGCPGCKAALGMENGLISDAQISASSEWDNNHGAERARLNGRRINLKRGAWSSRYNILGQWLQVDLEKYTTVTGLATQGRSDEDQWVTKYRMQYSDDGVSFYLYTEPGVGPQKLFDGNYDRNTIVHQKLSWPIRARCIRILPEAWTGHISLRMELYGCPACEDPLGMESEAFPILK